MAPKSHHSAESNIKIERCQKEFREWVTANWHTGVRAASGPFQSVNGPPEFESSQYVSYKSLEARLSLQGIKEVIDAAFPEHQGDHPISLLNLRADYSKVFATLLYMGIPRAISHFVQHDDLADHKLPFKPNQPPAEFPQDIDYSEFCRYQHLFKVKTVRYWREDVEQRVDILLPFEVLPQPLGEGGSAVAYKIKIHEDYDELYNGTDFTHKPHDIYRHHYALKTFTGPYAKRDYDRERNAYIRLTRQERASRSLICFHGCFRQGPSYNILLEYADMGTLEEYLRDIPAPTTGLGTYQFWNSMLSIVEALYQLQNVLTTDEHTSSNFRGWHDDISPWNILVSSRGRQPGDYYNYKFMLADLGHCHFSKISESGAFAYSAKAGKTYASPESYELDEKMSREKSIVTLKSDVWSLACIFSEGATWAVQGWPALETYRRNRQERLSRDKGFKHTDCFHDSVRVLDTVTQQHQMLRGERRRSDRTTDYILNAIDTIFTNDDSMNAKVCLNMFATAMNSAKLEMASRSPRHALSRSGTSYHFAGNAHESRRHEASRANTDFPIPPNSWNMPGSHTNTDRAFVEEDDYTQSPHSSPSTPRDGPMFSSNSTPIEQQTPFPSRMPRHRSTSGAKKWEQPLVLDGLRARSTTFVTDSDDSVQGDPFVEGSDQSPESKRHRRSISTSNPPTLSLFQKQGSSDSGQTNGSTENQNPVSTGPTLDDLAASLREQKPNGKMWKWPFSKHSTSTTSKDFFKRFQHLTGRDFDLVVDDAPSMHQYWLDMIYVITIMSEILLKFDKDGIDLHFVGCSQSYAKLKSHEKIEKRMQKHWPNKEMVATGANVGPDVGRFLDNLMTKLKDSWKSDKAKTIYVFTDGIWEDGSAVDGAIKRVVDYLERRSSPDFHFTLQFIQFGNDPVGTERLRHYDDHMKSLERDIVDTEGRGGNAHKIFAGSFNKKLDGPSSDVASCRFCQAARLRTKS